MIGIRRPIVCGITLLCLLLSAVEAGRGETPARTEAEIEASLARAQRFERSGNFLEAMNLYRELMAVPGARTRAYPKALRLAYSLERWADLEDIVRHRPPEVPEDPEVLLLLGEAVARQGRASEALKVWERAIVAGGGRIQILERASHLMREAGMVDRAAETLLAARRLVATEAMYALDLASLYLEQGKVDAAIDELLLWLRTYPQQVHVVEGELRRMLWDPERVDSVRSALGARAARPDHAVGLVPLVLALWVEMGWCGEALEMVERALDRQEVTRISLVDLGDACQAKGDTQAALGAYRLAVRRPAAERELGLLRLGHLLISLGRGAEAAATFEEFLDAYGGGPRDAEARQALARVLLRLGRPGDALQHARTLVERTPGTRAAMEARFLAAECLIGLGRLEDAARELDEVDPEALEPDQEEILFQRGEVLFLAGRFEDALTGYRGVVERFPEGSLVNDAISRMLLIGENRVGGEDALRLYAAALYLERLERWPEAWAVIDSLVETFPDGPLADDALLARAEIALRSDQPGPALETLDRLLGEHPESRHAPRAVLMKGDIRLEHLDDPAVARQDYEMLLMDYPESPLLEDARRRLRALEAAVP